MYLIIFYFSCGFSLTFALIKDEALFRGYSIARECKLWEPEPLLPSSLPLISNYIHMNDWGEWKYRLVYVPVAGNVWLKLHTFPIVSWRNVRDQALGNDPLFVVYSFPTLREQVVAAFKQATDYSLKRKQNRKWKDIYGCDKSTTQEFMPKFTWVKNLVR